MLLLIISQSALAQTLLLMPLVLGMYLSYRVMNLIDLTVEASFVLGAGVYAQCLIHHLSPLFTLALALSAGGLVGLGVACIGKVGKIDPLIASILAIFMLYSLNFQIMGRPNISLLGAHNSIANLQSLHPFILWMLIGSCIVTLLLVMAFFLHQNRGLLLRAYGQNKSLLSQYGKNPFFIFCIGLILSNTMSAFSGLISAQINGYADIHMGEGLALTAIGAMMIGLSTLARYRRQQHYSAPIELSACLLGVFAYFIVLNFLLAIGMNPIYLKLALGGLLIIFLSSGSKHHKEQQYV